MKPKNSEPSVFSARLRELRTTAKMTQQEIADHMGIRRSTYAYYETGAIEPPLSLLQRLAIEYRVTVGYLLGNEDFAETMPVRQSGSDPLAGAELMGECDREERAFLSTLRQLSRKDREKLQIYFHQLLSEASATEEMDGLFAAHIHTLEELDKD